MNLLRGPEPAPGAGPFTEIRVLGCFDVLVDGTPAALGGPLPQTMLARLVVADAPVAIDQLLEDVWGGDPPPRATASLHAYVSRLRAVFPPGALERGESGYRLDRRLTALDATAFEHELATARDAAGAGQLDAVAETLQRTLTRWHGPSAFGLRRYLPFLQAEAGRLEELRLTAVEQLADAHAGLGTAQVDLPPLIELVRLHPLRESLVLRLMRALTAAGRRGEALAAFERCRRALADELGVDPGEPLQDEHARLLARRSGRAPWRLPSRNRSFTGREDLIQQVDDVLAAGGGAPRLVALHGLPGVGKTELALEIAHRHRHQGDLAWWIPADGSASLTTGLAELAAALGVSPHLRPDELIIALWDELDRRGRWLIVFDNVDDVGLLMSVLPPTGIGGVLVTSRNPAWRSLGLPLQVRPFDREESRAFLTRRTGGGDVAFLDALAEALADLPLALEHACAYLDQTRIGLPDYLQLLHTQAEVVLATPGADRERPSVATTWAVAFDRVRRRSPGAAELLETLAFLAPDAVPVDLLRRGDVDELTVNEQVADLLRLSLVDREVDRESDVLRTHRLVQAVVRARLAAPVRRARLAGAVRLVTAAAEGLPPDRWGELVPQVLTLTDHLVDLAEVADATGPPTDDRVLVERLLDCAVPTALWLADRALFPAAIDEMRKAVRLARAAGDQVAQGLASSALGEILDRSGDWRSARHELEDAIEVLRAVLPPGDPRLAHAHNRLGHTLNCAGDPAAAVAAQQTAIALLRYADQPRQLADALTDLGYTYWGAGRLEGARSAFEDSLALLATLPDARPKLAHTLAGLGLVEQDGGDLVAAAGHQREALRIFTLEFGPLHPDVAQSYDKLGYVQRLLGDLRDSVASHERAVVDLEHIFGLSDPRVAMARTNAGLAYSAAGRYHDARRAQQQALDVFRATYGDQHPSTLITARRLAVAWAEDGTPAAGRQLAEEALRTVTRTRGRDDAETARAEAALALVLQALGDAESALAHRIRALGTLSRALGPDHPEVTALAADLAIGTAS